MNLESKPIANAQGYLAILVWSFSAFFTVQAEAAHPFLIASLTSLIGAMVFIPRWVVNPRAVFGTVKQPLVVWLLSVMSVIVYRGFYYTAFAETPPIEANLLNYLWPLLIVVLPVFIDRKKLSLGMITAASFCFAGVICIGLSDNNGLFHFETGHLLAIAGAFVWAIYSILTGRHKSVPMDMVGVMQVAAFVFFLLLHILFEPQTDVFALGRSCLLSLLALGVVSSGGIVLWDKAMKHGDPQLIAIAAYFTPLLSCLWLILFVHSPMTPLLWLATGLIISGALLARFAPRKAA